MGILTISFYALSVGFFLSLLPLVNGHQLKNLAEKTSKEGREKEGRKGL
jgi:hypothetical protein